MNERPTCAYEPRCLTHQQPQRVCRGTIRLAARCAVSEADYALLEADHLRFHDLLGTPPDELDGRCMSPKRECRCYWPEKQSPAASDDSPPLGGSGD